MHTSTRFLLCVTSLLLTTLSHAETEQTAGTQEKPLSNNFFGLAVAGVPKTPGNSSMGAMALPLIQYDYQDMAYIHGIKAGVWVYDLDDKKLRIGLYAEPRFGFKGSDSSLTNGMATRDLSIDFGPSLRWQTDIGVFNLDYGFDVLGKSNGQALRAQFTRPLVQQTGFVVNGVLGATWQNAAMNNYYYGVGAADTGGGLTQYSAASGTSTSVGVNGLYAFNMTGAVFFGATIHRLSDAQADSPIAERRYVPTLYLGYGWRM